MTKTVKNIKKLDPALVIETRNRALDVAAILHKADPRQAGAAGACIEDVIKAAGMIYDFLTKSDK